MSRRRRDRPVQPVDQGWDGSRYRAEPPLLNNTMVGVIAGLLLGVFAGYLIGIQSLDRPTYASATPVAPAPAASGGQGISEDEIRAYRNVVTSDPTNVRANVELANRLYDAGRYGEAVPYYQQAFALNPKDINVSTDLGTSLWYSGRADDALVQYDKSLAIDPKHAATLFNIGIVRRDGKQDFVGAIEAWERLVAASPNSPDATKARQAISDARRQAPLVRSAGS